MKGAGAGLPVIAQLRTEGLETSYRVRLRDAKGVAEQDDELSAAGDEVRYFGLK